MKHVMASVVSMGFLGLVFLLMTLAVVVGSYAAASNLDSLTVTWERIEALAVLEDDVSVHLRDMQLNELYFVYAIDYGAPVEDEVEMAAYHAGQIDLILDDLVAGGHFSRELDYYPEEIDLLADFRALLDEHRQSFAAVVHAYESGDLEAAIEDALSIQEENDELLSILESMIGNLDAARLEAALVFPEEIAFALLGASVALVALLVLALAGYRAIAQLGQPLVDLTNTVVAIGGDRYRPELPGALLKSGGPAGRFARALDAFAREIEGRDASLKKEIDDLCERLYESRRRRLKITDLNR
ncbi:MAG: hypothetical protein JXA93_08410 [Anaerolineae bacterium]|nr:hypothetical protein [Anaerolineae bacterium]